jgi:hypothetical protein
MSVDSVVHRTKALRSRTEEHHPYLPGTEVHGKSCRNSLLRKMVRLVLIIFDEQQRYLINNIRGTSHYIDILMYGSHKEFYV